MVFALPLAPRVLTPVFLPLQYEPFTTHSFAGNETVGQLRSDSVCSFFGFYYDTSGEKQEIEPAQCVGREPVDGKLQWVGLVWWVCPANL